MLSENDQKRLRDEEIYRVEVRQSLNAPKQGNLRRFFDVINKPIVLWLLSAIVATWWTNYLAEQSVVRNAASEKENRIERIREELVLTGVESARNILTYNCRINLSMATLRQNLPTVEMWQGPNADSDELHGKLGTATIIAEDILKNLKRMETEWHSKRNFVQAEFAQFTTVGLILVHERLSAEKLFPEAEATEIFTKINSLNALIKTLARLSGDDPDFDDKIDLTRRLRDALGDVQKLAATADIYSKTLVKLTGGNITPKVSTTACEF